MQVSAFLIFEPADWATWLTLGVGLAVSVVVFVLLSRYKRRLFLARAANEDLPWEKLLDHLRSRHRSLLGSAQAVDEDMPPEQFLSMLLSVQPGKRGPRTADISPADRQFQQNGGVERRTSRRRWGNPTEIYVDSKHLSCQLRGLIINRSAPGLAIFVNEEIQPGTTIKVRATEAPHSIPSVEMTVRYCRKTQRNFILGCQAQQDFPWNIRGWLG
jgi:hypothetical protein